MQTNAKLLRALARKNDEFYTFYKDIENELKYYPECFRGKIVYCNCDNPAFSNFPKYFVNNFHRLGLKQLNITWLSDEPYLIEIAGDTESQGNLKEEWKPLTELLGNLNIRVTPLPPDSKGSFSSTECLEILKSSDVVVTNPPYSKWWELIDTLDELKKDYLLVGGINKIYKSRFIEKIKRPEKPVRLGWRTFTWFYEPRGGVVDDGHRVEGERSYWITTFTPLPELPHEVMHPKDSMPDNHEFKKYDDYEAIDVPHLHWISLFEDYDGCIGVPCTFIQHYWRRYVGQWELIDSIRPHIDGKAIFQRILIRKIKEPIIP